MNTYVNEESIIYLPEDKIDKETNQIIRTVKEIFS